MRTTMTDREALRERLANQYRQELTKALAARTEREAKEIRERQESFRTTIRSWFGVEITDIEAAALTVDLAGALIEYQDGRYGGWNGWEPACLVLHVPCRDCGTLMRGPRISQVMELGEWYAGDLSYNPPQCAACQEQEEQDDQAATRAVAEQEPSHSEPVDPLIAVLTRIAEALEASAWK